MKIHYRKSGIIRYSGSFNLSTFGEVLTGDDSAFIRDLDVWLDQKQVWKSMSDAFRDRDLIVDNYNRYFFEPTNEKDRERGFTH